MQRSEVRGIHLPKNLFQILESHGEIVVIIQVIHVLLVVAVIMAVVITATPHMPVPVATSKINSWPSSQST